MIKRCRLGFVTGTEPTPFCFPAVRSESPLSMEQLVRNIQETNSKVIVN